MLKIQLEDIVFYYLLLFFNLRSGKLVLIQKSLNISSGKKRKKEKKAMTLKTPEEREILSCSHLLHCKK